MIYLQIVFKDFLIRMTAFAVCLWYCSCIMGFELHACSTAGQTYVSILHEEAGSCLAIHPDTLCGTGDDHCQKVHPVAVSGEDQLFSSVCCSDEIEQLEELYLLQQDYLYGYDPAALDAAVAATVGTSIVPQAEPEVLSAVPDEQDLFGSSGPDLLSFIRVFRI